MLLHLCASRHQVRLSEVLSRRINRTPSEAEAASSAEEVLRQTQLTNPEEGLALAPSGWHPVRASFEVDKVTSHRGLLCPRAFFFLDLIRLVFERATAPFLFVKCYDSKFSS